MARSVFLVGGLYCISDFDNCGDEKSFMDIDAAVVLVNDLALGQGT